MSDTKPFIIEHPDGRQYELRDYAFFRKWYEPQGFRIQNPPRAGYWGGPAGSPVADAAADDVQPVEPAAIAPEPAERPTRGKRPPADSIDGL